MSFLQKNNLKPGLFLVIFLTAAFGACAQYAGLANKPYAARYAAIDSLFYSDAFSKLDPASAGNRISELETVALQNKDKELLLEVRLVRIAYNNVSGRYGKKQYLDSLYTLLEAAKEANDMLMHIRVHYMLSMEYYKSDRYNKAFEHQVKYYELLKNISPEEFPWKKTCIAHIGNLYYSFEDFPTAKKYLLMAAAISGSYKKDGDINVLNTLGLIERKMQRYDSAIYYFNQALQLAEQYHIPGWYRVLHGNIGITYYYQGKYDAAIPLLKEDIEQGQARNDYENIINSVVKLADIYRLRRHTDSARYYSRMARGFIGSSWHPYIHLVSLYQLMSQLSAEAGDKDLALLYADSVITAKDSVANRTRVLLMARAHQEASEERYKREIESIRREKESGINKRNNLIILLSLGGVIGMLLFNRQLILRKKVMAEKKLADNQLRHARQRLDAFTRTLNEKNALIDDFSAQVEMLQSPGKEDKVADAREYLARLQRSTILTDDQWNDFRDTFEQVHAGFIDRLKDKLPNLTPAEVRIMVLLKLKMDNKQMAGVLGIDAGTVRYHKHNLRKKVEGSSDETLEDLAQNL